LIDHIAIGIAAFIAWKNEEKVLEPEVEAGQSNPATPGRSAARLRTQPNQI
jgi:hypothetical protein